MTSGSESGVVNGYPISDTIATSAGVANAVHLTLSAHAPDIAVATTYFQRRSLFCEKSFVAKNRHRAMKNINWVSIKTRRDSMSITCSKHCMKAGMTAAGVDNPN